MNYHELFQKTIIEPLIKVYSDIPMDEPEVEISMFYEPRKSGYDHNYQREKDLLTRDIVFVGSNIDNKQHVAIVSFSRVENKAIIYRDAMEFLFNDKAAMVELLGLLRKYYTTEIRDRSRLSYVDTSIGHRQQDINLYEIR